MPLVATVLLFAAVPTGAVDRPGAGAGPTEVEVGLYLVDVVSIDDATQTMEVDFALLAHWKDPRLAARAGTTMPLGEAWAPNFQVIGDAGLRLVRPEEVRVGEGGEVEYVQRYVGKLAHRIDVTDFPFDEQDFTLAVATPLETPADIAMVEYDGGTGQSGDLSVVGWVVEPGRWMRAPYRFPPTGEEFPGAAYTFRAKRERGYYLWKVIVPLSLVVFMSWAVFWIDPANSGSQISVAVTSVLTLIAYRFVIGGMVPPVSYLTRMDAFVLGASLLVFFVLAEAVWTGRLAAEGHEAQAVRIDRWCRVVFPSAFVVLVVYAFAL